MDLNDILKNFSNSSNSNSSGLQNVLPLLMKGEFSNENLMNMLGKSNPSLGLMMNLMAKPNNKSKKQKKTLSYVKVYDYYSKQ